MLAFPGSSPDSPSAPSDSPASGRSRVPPLDRPDFTRLRPSIDAVLAEETWQRTEQFFRAISDRAITTVIEAYQPEAVLQSPVIGDLAGREIHQLWTTFLRRTKAPKLDFTIARVQGQTAFVEWSAEHEFFDTGRPVSLSGSTVLTFQHGRIRHQQDQFDHRLWAAQAMGLSGLILSYLPGSRNFFRAEIRRVLGIDVSLA